MCVCRSRWESSEKGRLKVLSAMKDKEMKQRDERSGRGILSGEIRKDLIKKLTFDLTLKGGGRGSYIDQVGGGEIF